MKNVAATLNDAHRLGAELHELTRQLHTLGDHNRPQQSIRTIEEILGCANALHAQLLPLTQHFSKLTLDGIAARKVAMR